MTDLAISCSQLEALAREALAWASKPANRARIVNFDGVARDLRRNARTAMRLAAAAVTRPSIAVYGASQAGKSYLIAHLAAPPGGSGGQSAVVLPKAQKAGVTLPGGGMRFLDINPPGGRESTGLVTRFTTRQVAADQAFPVAVKLLSALDLVKILMSCYAVDLDMSDEQAMKVADIDAAIQQAQGVSQLAAAGLDQDDLFELEALCRRRQSAVPQFRALLDADFFGRAAPLAGRLGATELTRLLAPLWNNVQEISATFQLLYDALAALSFTSQVHCELDALHERADASGKALSIIDVDTLKRLMQRADEKINVRFAGGILRLDRPVVTALAAELVLEIVGETPEFLRSVDLLDFPGARSRGGISRTTLGENVEDVFLRGKVAHLFDRYRDEYDLTSMLLCIGPDPQEVLELARLVDEWVPATHGKTPEERQGKLVSLFVVLTKFDRMFEFKAGAKETSSDRWISRIDASITKFLARNSSWPLQWTPGSAFNNVFWYRNPFIEQSHVFDLETLADGLFRERAVLERLVGRIGEMKNAYDQSPLVQKHFREPQAAWDAVMTLNDGGLTYLVTNLSELARSDLKARQIERTAQQIAETTARAIKDYYFETDPSAQIEGRRREARKIANELLRAGLERRFGRALARLTVTPDELARLYRSVRLHDANAPATAAVPPDIGDDLVSMILEGKTPTAPDGGGQRPPPVTAGRAFIDCDAPHGLDLAARFACRSFGLWADRLRALANDNDYLRDCRMSAGGCQTLAAELLAASSRMRLVDQIAVQVRPLTSYATTSADFGASSPALAAAEFINDFVSYVGRGARVVDAEAKSKAQTAKVLFAASPARDTPELGVTPRDHQMDYCKDWVGSFLPMVEANAVGGTGPTFDEAENAVLGKILGQLGSTKQS